MASFGKEIREFVQAMGAGQRLVTSMSDREYKRLRQQLLQTQIDRANDPEMLALDKDIKRARANRLNRGPDPELTQNRRLRGRLLQKQIDLLDKEPAQAPSAVDDVPSGYGPPPSAPKPDKVSALDLGDGEEFEEPTQLASRGGAIKRVKTYAAGGAVEADDDMDSDVGGEGDELIEDDEELPEDEEGLDEPTMSRGYSPLAAQDAVVAGLKYAKQATGMESGEQGGAQPREALPLEVSAQSRQPRVQSVRGYLRGMGAASPDEVAAVRKKIDPEGKLSESESVMAGLAHVYEYYLKQGQPERANRAAASLIQYHRQVSSRYQALAQVAAQNGDVDGTVKALAKAHSNIPDGKDLKVMKRQDGSLAYSMVDTQTGKTVEQNIATPDQILAFASRGGIQSFDEFLQRTGNAPKAPTNRTGARTPRLSDVKAAGEMVENEPVDPKLDKDQVAVAKDVASGIVRANPGDVSPRDAMSIATSAFDPAQNLPAKMLEDGGAVILLPDKREVRVPRSTYLQIQAQRGKRAATKKAEDEKVLAEDTASKERMKRSMDRQQPYLDDPIPPGGKTYTDRTKREALPVLR